MSDKTHVLETITSNLLYVVPLHSIRADGSCTCGLSACGSAGKHPLFRFNWKVIASNDPKKVEKWSNLPWKMNLAVATGRLSPVTGKYLVVVDVDAGSHPILNQLPETFRYRTGSGGWHLWFWSPVPVRNSVGALAPKVDVRGTDGYVVIPPSRHISGSYGEVDPRPLADLPEPLVRLLVSRTAMSGASPKQQKRSREKPSAAPAEETVSWQNLHVPAIKEKMKTSLVPAGTRNVVMHKLLSSDRAKGATFQELQQLCRDYLPRFEDSESFEPEVTTIINSVLKYPAHNNEHEKVNDLYFAWLKKHRGVTVSKEDRDHLVQKDTEFFTQRLQHPEPGEEYAGISLKQVHEARHLFLDKSNVRWVSFYKAQLLARRLTDLGFTRRRTSKGNLWLVKLPCF